MADTGPVRTPFQPAGDGQAAALDLLGRDRRTMVTGWAGTGKSALAAEWARRLAAEGHEVLFVCATEPVAERLRLGLSGCDRLTVGTVHQVAHRIVARAGLAPASPDRALPETLPTQLPRAARALGMAWDAVVVDEGHELHGFWWAALRHLLRDADTSRFHVFADAYPDAYGDWDAPFDVAEPLELVDNLRSTPAVVGRVAALARTAAIRVAAAGANGAGSAPVFVEIERGGDPTRHIARHVRDLLAAGTVRPEGIAVLTTERQLVDTLQGKLIDGHRLVQAGAPGITVDLIQRFKGLECDAALVALGEVATRGDRALAYVGLSRPRLHLTVYGTAPVRKALAWA